MQRCAAALTELGVGPGDVVAVYLPNRWLLGPLLFACARIGAVSSPVIPVLAGRELAHVLDASRAAVCVTVDSFGGVDYDRRLAEVAPATLKHRVVVGDAARTGAIDFDEFFVRTPWEQRRPLDGVAPSGPDDPVLLLYTSGTTGAMKAVVHSQNTLYAAARTVAESQHLGPDDVISVPNFLTHMAGSSFAVSMPVLLGATTVMQDNNTDMELFLDLVERHRISWAYLSPSYLVNLLRIQRETPRDTSSLHRVVSGSAPVQPDIVADVRTVLDVPLHTLWGMTENGGVTLTRPDDPEGWGAQSDGRPMPWMQVRIATEPGEQLGRLLVRGASQTLGYLGQRDLYEPVPGRRRLVRHRRPRPRRRPRRHPDHRPAHRPDHPRVRAEGVHPRGGDRAAAAPGGRGRGAGRLPRPGRARRRPGLRGGGAGRDAADGRGAPRPTCRTRGWPRCSARTGCSSSGSCRRTRSARCCGSRCAAGWRSRPARRREPARPRRPRRPAGPGAGVDARPPAGATGPPTTGGAPAAGTGAPGEPALRAAARAGRHEGWRCG